MWLLECVCVCMCMCVCVLGLNLLPFVQCVQYNEYNHWTDSWIPHHIVKNVSRKPDKDIEYDSFRKKRNAAYSSPPPPWASNMFIIIGQKRKMKTRTENWKGQHYLSNCPCQLIFWIITILFECILDIILTNIPVRIV